MSALESQADGAPREMPPESAAQPGASQAKTGLILSLLGLFCLLPFVGGLLGMLYGARALREFRVHSGSRWTAVIALAVGAIGVGINAWVLFGTLGSFQRLRALERNADRQVEMFLEAAARGDAAAAFGFLSDEGRRRTTLGELEAFAGELRRRCGGSVRQEREGYRRVDEAEDPVNVEFTYRLSGSAGSCRAVLTLSRGRDSDFWSILSARLEAPR